MDFFPTSTKNKPEAKKEKKKKKVNIHTLKISTGRDYLLEKSIFGDERVMMKECCAVTTFCFLFRSGSPQHTRFYKSKDEDKPHGNAHN